MSETGGRISGGSFRPQEDSDRVMFQDEVSVRTLGEPALALSGKSLYLPAGGKHYCVPIEHTLLRVIEEADFSPNCAPIPTVGLEKYSLIRLRKYSLTAKLTSIRKSEVSKIRKEAFNNQRGFKGTFYDFNDLDFGEIEVGQVMLTSAYEIPSKNKGLSDIEIVFESRHYC